MAQLYGYAVEEEQAVATVSAAFAGPVNFLDTSNGYGEDGTAERRIGEAIRRAGGLPDGVVLATKVDPDPRTGDFSGDRVRASLEESMERLGDRPGRAAAPARPGADHLRRGDGSGRTGGGAGGPAGAGAGRAPGGGRGPGRGAAAYVDTGAFEVVLSHNRYTLLDRSAEPLFAVRGRPGSRRPQRGPLRRRHAGQGPERAAEVRLRRPRRPDPAGGGGDGGRVPAATASRSPRRPCSSRCARR